MIDGMVDALRRPALVEALGRVRRVSGTLVEGSVPHAAIGELCEMFRADAPERTTLCEVVGFMDDSVLLSSLSSLEGVSPAFHIRPLRRVHRVPVHPGLLGRIVDGFGAPLDEGPAVDVPDAVWRAVIASAPPPAQRPRITEVFVTGVRSLDALLTMGVGQRVGLFAGPGCGKTTLMAAIARGADVDAVVLGLIGERGREVREFTEHEFGPAILAKTVIVCATSDRTSIERVRAAFTATAIAEGLRDQGLRVLLVVDSLTRLARAQREIGLAAGEMPARAGFPPSVYSLLPRLVERAGPAPGGSITALYTVLVEGDIKLDPIAEEAMSLLDGHVVLARKLAEQGHYPAVDVLPSISRVMSNVVARPHLSAAARAREILSRYREVELLVRLGEYRRDLDAEMDAIVDAHPRMLEFLRQDTRRSESWRDSLARLSGVTGISPA